MVDEEYPVKINMVAKRIMPLHYRMQQRRARARANEYRVSNVVRLMYDQMEKNKENINPIYHTKQFITILGEIELSMASETDTIDDKL